MNKQYNIQVIERAANIIEILKKHPYGISLKEITKEVEINKTTIFRILSTLITLNYIIQDNVSGKYMLGYKFIELSNTVIERFDVRKSSRPYLEDLALITGEVIHLVILDDNQGLYIDKVENSKATIRMHSAIGNRTFLHSSGVGKVLLSYLPEQEILNIVQKKGLIKFTENTITTLEDLMIEIKKIKKLGYSIDEMENEEGIRCVACPIFDYNGAVVASVSIAGPTLRITKERLPELIYLLVECASKISSNLGCLGNKD